MPLPDHPNLRCRSRNSPVFRLLLCFSCSILIHPYAVHKLKQPDTKPRQVTSRSLTAFSLIAARYGNIGGFLTGKRNRRTACGTTMRASPEPFFASGKRAPANAATSSSMIALAGRADFNRNRILDSADWFHWTGITPAPWRRAASSRRSSTTSTSSASRRCWRWPAETPPDAFSDNRHAKAPRRKACAALRFWVIPGF